ncbi:ArsR/SmtB family transcription factor [Peptoniphilus raoultii]|uniref:ArsR/SmtB family transcription factor n=1 Tax=Peptoniphilus raoultii TaxID=1776387 RepID=UPI0008D9BCC9|nr:metalloregulator ArsR/SmtB family transcription factor [Peptoniphilus raoultii]
MENKKLPHHHKDNENEIFSFLIEAELAKNISKILSKLSDPTRLAIFYLLSQKEECVINIAALMNMTSPAISHHLRILKLEGLITSKRQGKEMFYKAADNDLSKFLIKIIENAQNLMVKNL